MSRNLLRIFRRPILHVSRRNLSLLTTGRNTLHKSEHCTYGTNCSCVVFRACHLSSFVQMELIRDRNASFECGSNRNQISCSYACRLVFSSVLWSFPFYRLQLELEILLTLLLLLNVNFMILYLTVIGLCLSFLESLQLFIYSPILIYRSCRILLCRFIVRIKEFVDLLWVMMTLCSVCCVFSDPHRIYMF